MMLPFILRSMVNQNIVFVSEAQGSQPNVILAFYLEPSTGSNLFSWNPAGQQSLA
jgi:hypothetical protein